MYNKQKIRCDVETCKYLNCDEAICTLYEIKVSKNSQYPKSKDDAICSSYKKRK